MLVPIQFDLDNLQVYRGQAVQCVLFRHVELDALAIWTSKLQRKVLCRRVWEFFRKIGVVERHGEPVHSKGENPQR